VRESGLEVAAQESYWTVQDSNGEVAIFEEPVVESAVTTETEELVFSGKTVTTSPELSSGIIPEPWPSPEPLPLPDMSALYVSQKKSFILHGSPFEIFKGCDFSINAEVSVMLIELSFVSGKLFMNSSDLIFFALMSIDSPLIFDITFKPLMFMLSS